MNIPVTRSSLPSSRRLQEGKVSGEMLLKIVRNAMLAYLLAIPVVEYAVRGKVPVLMQWTGQVAHQIWKTLPNVDVKVTPSSEK